MLYWITEVVVGCQFNAGVVVLEFAGGNFVGYINSERDHTLLYQLYVNVGLQSVNFQLGMSDFFGRG